MVTEQMKYPEVLEQLRKAYEQEKIQLTTKISTLEVSVSQLESKIKKLENFYAEIGEDWRESVGMTKEDTDYIIDTINSL